MVRTLMLAVDSAACHLSRPTEGGEGGEKILIVRLDAMGDLVLFLDALRELRRIFPSPSFDITLAVNSLWSELLSGQDLVDRILPVDRNRLLSSPWYRFRIMSQLRRGGFQLAVNPAYSREAMLADAMVRATAAPRRVGWQGSPDNISRTGRALSDRWFTQLLPPGSSQLMELERNALFVRSLAAGDFEASLPRLRVNESWLKEAEELLAGTPAADGYSVLIPGTGPPPERSWPGERWACLARRIREESGLAVVFCGSTSGPGSAVHESGPADAGIIDLTGRTRVSQLAGIIAGARVLVGSDTGPVHLAPALGIPAVCVLGGAFSGRFFPYPEGIEREYPAYGGTLKRRPAPLVVRSPYDCRCANWNCKSRRWRGGTFPCVLDIGVEEVMDAFGRALKYGSRG